MRGEGGESKLGWPILGRERLGEIRMTGFRGRGRVEEKRMTGIEGRGRMEEIRMADIGKREVGGNKNDRF